MFRHLKGFQSLTHLYFIRTRLLMNSNLRTSPPNTQGWFLSLLRPVPKGDTFHCVTWKDAFTIDWLFSLVACWTYYTLILGRFRVQTLFLVTIFALTCCFQATIFILYIKKLKICRIFKIFDWFPKKLNSTYFNNYFSHKSSLGSCELLYMGFTVLVYV